jgi:DNA-binding NarL/FixJ family response regulator
MTNGTYGTLEFPAAAVEGWSANTHKTVCICDTQPVTAEGLRTLLSASPDLEFQQATDSLSQATELMQRLRPAVLVIDKALGIQAILDWLLERRASDALEPRAETAVGAFTTGIVIWGTSVTEAEALRFLQAGAKGILRKTAGVQMIFSCLRTVACGRSWMEDCVFRDSGSSDRYPRSELTLREQQVLVLVEQGYKNKEIAQDLGIRPGTVKIHLKHIFEKTGVRGRYGLAINGLRERAFAPVPA